MPSYILKVTPNADRYVEWTTISEGPTYWGTRNEMAEHLREGGGKPVEIESRLQRADERGTSAPDGDFEWGDGILIVEQRGMLDRSNLGAFLDSYDGKQRVFDYSLLRPFDG